MPWMYVVGIGLVVILIFAAVFVIKVNFFPTQITDEETGITEIHTPASSKTNDGFKKESLNENLIGLVAKAPIYIYVTQTKNNEILFSGRLDTNQRKIIIRDGEISIACDKSENLIIEKGGLPIDLKGTTGKAQLVVD